MRLTAAKKLAAAGSTARKCPAPTSRQARAAARFSASMGSSPAAVTEQKMPSRFMGRAP